MHGFDLHHRKDWKVNNPNLNYLRVLKTLEKIQKGFNTKSKTVSLADLIVLGGCVGIEKAAKACRPKNKSPIYTAGTWRRILKIKQTYILLVYLEPKADGFRNYIINKPNGSTE